LDSKAGQVLGPPPHGRFHPLLWLRWFLHSIRWTGGDGPASSQTRASPPPTLTQTVTATLPPHAVDKRQASRTRAGGSPPYCTSHGPTGSLETGGPHAALLSAISDPCLVPRKILDPCRQMSLTSFWRVLGANHFGAALVQTSPNFYLLSFMIPPVRSAQGPCKQCARKQVRSMRPIEPMHLDLPSLDF
jgi:hypothetical protein